MEKLLLEYLPILTVRRRRMAKTVNIAAAAAAAGGRRDPDLLDLGGGLPYIGPLRASPQKGTAAGA